VSKVKKDYLWTSSERKGILLMVNYYLKALVLLKINPIHVYSLNEMMTE
jgi:hypothetical protein